MYLDYDKQDRQLFTIDLETDGLNPSVIWVMCWQNVKTGDKGECRGHDAIEEFFEGKEDCWFLGHNILGFDGPVLNRLLTLSVTLDASNCLDTLVMSNLYRPSLSGGHSLDAWGERLGNQKIEFNDWSRLSQEMVDYCHQDVSITTTLFKRLVKTLLKVDFSERSIWLQHNLTEISNRQQQTGFKFDGERALQLYTDLRQHEQSLQRRIYNAFPPVRTLVAERSLRRKDGSYTAIYLRDKERYIIDINESRGTYSAYEDVEFNLGSPPQRVDKLLSLGWKPRDDERTPRTKKGGGGNPKPFDSGELVPSLEEFLEENDVPEVRLIAEWMIVNGRANMLNNWLENWNEETGCIHGRLFVADTLRFRHQSPNTANIPAVRQKKDGSGVLLGFEGGWSYETRDLWTARQGRVLVGTDASGLELRMLAHYLNRPAFTEQVVEGDPHQYNADTVGITRVVAKTLIYAIMYGAAAPKIAATLGVSVGEGAKIRNMFLDRLGLGDLIDECKNEQAKGRITLCDGSQVVCPSPHAALNYKLQGGGARVMGLGSVLLEKDVRNRQLDALKVGDIHDEWQYDVLSGHAEEYIQRSIQAIRKSGELMSLNVPLDADAKQGLTWAETH